jgi:hypothetical protein
VRQALGRARGRDERDKSLPQSLLTILPNPDHLLALEPEDLAGVLLEVVPGVMQNGHFQIHDLLTQLIRPFGPTYSPGVQRPVQLALAEAHLLAR